MKIITGGSGLLGNAFKKILPNELYPTREELNLIDKTSIIKYIDKYNLSPNTPGVSGIIHLAGMVGGVKANTEKVFESKIQPTATPTSQKLPVIQIQPTATPTSQKLPKPENTKNRPETPSVNTSTFIVA